MANKVAEEEQTFEEHFQRLETLSQDLQDGQITIDALIPRMKQALQSIKVCKSILKETQTQLTEVSAEFKEIESEAAE